VFAEFSENQRSIAMLSILPKKEKKNSYVINQVFCRGAGPKSSLSMYILGLGPNLRTKGHPRRSEHC